MEQKKSIHAGHRERIRERFRKEGLDGFSEHEVLELLLTYAIPQKDVNPLAHELVERFGSISRVLEAPLEDLVRVPGVGTNAATLLTMMPSLLSFYQRSAMGVRPQICNLAQARDYCRSLFIGAREELFYMICLDKAGHVIYPALLHKGTVDEVPVYPRVMVETALKHNAHGVLLAHNHPGGIGRPSQADYDTTSNIIAALSVIGVGVVDHLIVFDDEVYSMIKQSEFRSCVKEQMSYVIRSDNVSGRQGKLRAEAEFEFMTMGKE